MSRVPFTMLRPAHPVLRFWHWLIGPPPRDHRGRRVKIITITQLPRSMASRISKLPPDVHDRVLSDLFRQPTPSMWPQLLVLFALLLPAIACVEFFVKPLIVTLVSPAFGKHLSMFLVGLPFALLIPSVFMFWGRRVSKSITITSTLKFNHCPSCGYSLETAKPDPADHCTLCPECGAAWRLPTTTQPT